MAKNTYVDSKQIGFSLRGYDRAVLRLLSPKWFSEMAYPDSFTIRKAIRMGLELELKASGLTDAEIEAAIQEEMTNEL